MEIPEPVRLLILTLRALAVLFLLNGLSIVAQAELITTTMVVTALIGAAVSTGISFGLQFIASKLQKKPNPIEINKTDPRVQAYDYGDPITRLYGQCGAVAGNVIYQSDIRTTTTRTGGGSSKRGSQPEQIKYSYSQTVWIRVCAVPPDGQMNGVVKVLFDADVIAYQGAATGDNVIFSVPNGGTGYIRLGKPDQAPHPVLESLLGVGNVPAGRGYLDIVFVDLVLDEYGNRLPNIQAWVDQGDGNVASIATNECRLAGYNPATDLDFSQIENLTIGGLYATQRGQIRTLSLEPLTIAKQFDFLEVDGKIVAATRPQPVSLTIPLEHLGEYDEGEEQKSRNDISRKMNSEIPVKVDVVYFDSGRDYERNTQSHRREIYNGADTETITLPIAMDANEAQRIARTRAVVNWTERNRNRFSISANYLALSAGDVVNVPTKGGLVKEFRIERISAGLPGRLNIEAIEQLSEAYNQSGKGDTGALPPNAGAFYQPVDTILWLGNPPDGINDADKLFSRYYVAVTPADGSTRNWKGARVYRALDNEGAYQELCISRTPATIGVVLDALQTVQQGIDNVSSVRVQLYYGTLASITQDTFDNTETVNLCAFGDEFLQFRDATYEGNNIWRLKYFDRGLRNTTSKTSGHKAGESFCLIDAAVIRLYLNQDEAPYSYQHVAVTIGRQLEEGTTQDFTASAEPPTV